VDNVLVKGLRNEELALKSLRKSNMFGGSNAENFPKEKIPF